MAKFRAAYGLCPLIDSSSLLGAEVDRDADCVIVTVGRNIVIRYKFQDQKQVNSWSSKDKMTSSVIYNSFNSSYTAIFNQDQLRMWKGDDQLDKVKKYKFQEQLHCVIPDPDKNDAFVLYRCGHVATLAQALESRKSAVGNPILRSNETIKDPVVFICDGVKYIGFVSCKDEEEMNLNVVPVVCGTPALRFPVPHTNKGETIIGHTIMSRNNAGFLLTLWSDGSLFSFKFLPEAEVSFPGTFIQKISSVSPKHPVAVSVVGQYLAFFGADSSEEGAVLILFNLQFQLIQARLHFKLYTKPPRIWNVNNHLLVAVGYNLIAVPYLLKVEQLANLVGVHSCCELRTEASWGETVLRNVDEETLLLPEKVADKLKALQSRGYSQATILQKLLPDLLEAKDYDSVLWFIRKFSDFPEHIVVQLLMFCLTALGDPTSAESSVLRVPENDLADASSESTHQLSLLNAVLNVSLSEVCMIPQLKRLPSTAVVTFLNYLNDLLDERSDVHLSTIVNWLSLVLDSHYQEFLLSQNEEVSSLLISIKEKVLSELECIEDLKKLRALLHKLRSGKLPLEPLDMAEKRYSVEELQLY